MTTNAEFKTQASDFFRGLHGCTIEQMNNGFKQLGIAYLNLDTICEMEQYEAALTYQIAADRVIREEAASLYPGSRVKP